MTRKTRSISDEEAEGMGKCKTTDGWRKEEKRELGKKKREGQEKKEWKKQKEEEGERLI